MRVVNQAGRDLVTSFEGCKLNRYTDVAGFATIGVGHKITPEDNIGDSITQEQCDQLFEKDLAYAASEVERLVRTQLSDNQFASLVDFCFNLGGVRLESSTLLRELNIGDFSGAAEQFGRWVYSGADVIPGLIRRRAAEKVLFLKPDNI